MKLDVRALVLTAGLSFLSQAIYGAGTYLQVTYPPSAATKE